MNSVFGRLDSSPPTYPDLDEDGPSTTELPQPSGRAVPTVRHLRVRQDAGAAVSTAKFLFDLATSEDFLMATDMRRPATAHARGGAVSALAPGIGAAAGPPYERPYLMGRFGSVSPVLGRRFASALGHRSTSGRSRGSQLWLGSQLPLGARLASRRARFSRFTRSQFIFPLTVLASFCCGGGSGKV
jgi:hypothetical protein